MKGVANLAENEVMTMTPETQMTTENTEELLSTTFRKSLQSHFDKLDGQTPDNLYSKVLAKFEKPLIEMVLKWTNGNQSKAAIILGISRGTLRKKMAIYQLLSSETK